MNDSSVNDLSMLMAWGHLMSDLSFRAIDKEKQKEWAQTIWVLLRGRGESINRENVMAQYNILMEG